MKRKWIVFLGILLGILVILSTVLCGCGDKAAEQTEYIGIISAIDNEIDILLKEAEIDRVDAWSIILVRCVDNRSSSHGQESEKCALHPELQQC